MFWDAIYKYELFDDDQLKSLRKRAILRGGAMILTVLMTGMAAWSIGTTADSVVLYIFVPLMLGATVLAVMAVIREEEIRRELLRRKDERLEAELEGEIARQQEAVEPAAAYLDVR